MPNERLTLEIAAQAIGGEQIDRLSSSLEQFHQSVEKMGSSGGGRRIGTEIGEGMDHAIPRIAAASGAIREFEGTLPIRAVERFLSDTLGLGNALQALFPIVGAIATIGIGAKLANEFDPAIKAQKELTEATKKTDETFEQLGRRLETVYLQSAKFTLGGVRGAQVSAFYSDTELAEDKARIGYLSGLIERTKQQISKEQADIAPTGNLFKDLNPFLLGQRVGEIGTGIPHFYEQGTLGAHQTDIERYRNEMDELNYKVLVGGQERDAETAQAKKEAAEEATRQTDEQRKRAQSLVDAERARSLARSPVARAIFEANKDTASFTDPQAREAAAGAGVSAVNRSALEELQKNAAETMAGIEKENSEKLKKWGGILEQCIRTGEEAVAADRKVIELQDSLTRESGEAQKRSISSSASFQSKLISLSSLSPAQKAAALGQIDLSAAEQQHSSGIANASGLMDPMARAEALHKTEMEYQEELQDAKEKGIERIIELENQQFEQEQKAIESFKEEVGSLFDAATSRNPLAIRNWLREQMLSAGKTLTEDLVGQYIFPQINKVPGLAHPIDSIEKVLGIGGKSGQSPLQLATADNTAATRANTLALQAVQRQISTSPSSGGGSLGGLGGGGIFSSLGLGGGAGGDDLPIFSGPSWAGNIGPGDLGLGGDLGGDDLPISSGPSWAGNIGGGVASMGSGFGLGTGLTSGLGILGAIQGFSKGGAGGDLQGAAGIMGAIAPFTGPAAPFLEAGAMVLGMFSSIFGSNPQKRANQLSTEIGQAQYIAPTAMNVTESGAGTFADFGYKGNLRTSNFSPYPQVSEGYVWEQTHGLFGGPPTFYTVPGGQTSQFGPTVPSPAPGAQTGPPAPAPAPVQHIYNGPVIQGDLHAIDTQSGADFLQKNYQAVSDAAGKGLQNGHGTLAREVSRAAKYS